jgi:hypothetical protein
MEKRIYFELIGLFTNMISIKHFGYGVISTYSPPIVGEMSDENIRELRHYKEYDLLLKEIFLCDEEPL